MFIYFLGDMYRSNTNQCILFLSKHAQSFPPSAPLCATLWLTQVQTGEGELPEGGVGAEGEEGEGWVVVEVDGGDAVGQDVDDTHGYDLAVQGVVLVERTKATLRASLSVHRLQSQQIVFSIKILHY